MPDLVVFIGGSFVLSILLSIILGLYHDYPPKLNDKQFRNVLIVWAMMCVLLFVWWVLYFSAEPKYVNEEVLEVKTERDIDFVIYNDVFINLNEKFGRSFEEGDKVRCRTIDNCYYYGLFPVTSREDRSVVEPIERKEQ